MHTLTSNISISVVIPVYNGEETLSETIASLQKQTYPNWEAIIVDDGSSDQTIAVAEKLAQKDSRVRVISQANQGVSGARNTGIQASRYDWLLFLDADDTIAPVLLERFVEQLRENPELDFVYCGWVYTTLYGDCIPGEYWHPSTNLFSMCAYCCPFAVHACLVRRSLVEEVGSFDITLKTCEDWDLWQRITRSTSRCALIPEALAMYRIRFNSLSRKTLQIFQDGMRVIQRAHESDPRVPNPQPQYASGIGLERLADSQQQWIAFALGQMIGEGKSLEPILDTVTQLVDVDPELLARGIFESAILLSGQQPSTFIEFWHSIKEAIRERIEALERQSQTLKLLPQALHNLERLILGSVPDFPQTLDITHAIRVEVTQPIPDVSVSPSIERLYCQVEIEGDRLGVVELPICDGYVSSAVLKDAIAHQFNWIILGHYLKPIYRQLRYETDETGVSVWRDSLCLATGLPPETSEQQIHDRIGWTVFLQELWDLPNWAESDFYRPYWKNVLRGIAAGRPQFNLPFTRIKPAEKGWVVLEISQPLPAVTTSSTTLSLVPVLGGISLGVIKLDQARSLISPQTLRKEIIQQCGLELITAALREGFIGHSIESCRLHDLLAKANLSTSWVNIPETLTDHLAPQIKLNEKTIGRSTLPDLVLARHPGDIGTSASRRAGLPAGAIANLTQAASQTILALTTNSKAETSAYIPELILQSTQPYISSAPSPVRAATASDRSYFETLFATEPDPWKYTNPYEQTKYEQTLELLPDVPIQSALEIACAEGHFTVQLAPRVNTLLAVDISEIALQRTAERCAAFSHIQYQQFDLVKDDLPGRFDLIVCSEVLYFLGSLDALKGFAEKVAAALNPGGYFLSAHANLVVDEPTQTGYNWDHAFGAKRIGEIFAQTPSLSLIKELQTPLYRIQLFQRVPEQASLSQPEIIAMEQPTPPPAVAADTVLWQGGSPYYWDKKVETTQLPILMYHRVAASGNPTTARYRVTPEAFEAQLRYLRDAGYYSIRLDEWQQAAKYKKPLPGRAIILTFDDAYRDFLTDAFPLLQRYGFSAVVFVVTEEVGQFNRWDQAYGEEIPLLSWEEIVFLQSEGIEFGSHTASHAPLTSLSPAGVVQQGIRSRSILEQKLGKPIQAIAYPYGDQDAIVQHLMGACGYLYGLTCRSGKSSFSDSLLSLPRLEIQNTDSLKDFVAKLQ